MRLVFASSSLELHRACALQKNASFASLPAIKRYYTALRIHSLKAPTVRRHRSATGGMNTGAQASARNPRGGENIKRNINTRMWTFQALLTNFLLSRSPMPFIIGYFSQYYLRRSSALQFSIKSSENINQTHVRWNYFCHRPEPHLWPLRRFQTVFRHFF